MKQKQIDNLTELEMYLQWGSNINSCKNVNESDRKIIHEILNHYTRYKTMDWRGMMYISCRYMLPDLSGRGINKIHSQIDCKDFNPTSTEEEINFKRRDNLKKCLEEENKQ